jgi:hypothetical protein
MFRTTHDKTYDDLMKCTRLPFNAEIFFLDDVYHPEMCNKNVYYINIKPYVHALSFKTMVTRFVNSKVGTEYLQLQNQNVNEFKDNMLTCMAKYNLKIEEKHENDYAIDKILGKQIMHHLQDFFKT